METDSLIYKCTACSECFMAEEIFFAHTRTWHCKILISEGHDPQPIGSDLSCIYVKGEPLFQLDSHAEPGDEKNFETQPVAFELMDDEKLDFFAPFVESSAPVIRLDEAKNVPPDVASQLDNRSFMPVMFDVEQDRLSTEKQNFSATKELEEATFFTNQSQNMFADARTKTSKPRWRNSRTTSLSKLKNLHTDPSKSDPRLQRVTGFACKFCKKVFPSISLLTRHERIHTGERPYECSICHMRFKRTDHVQGHLRRHFREKTCAQPT